MEEEYVKRCDDDMLKELLDHPGNGRADISMQQWEMLRRGGTISVPFADHSEFLTDSGKMKIVNYSLPDPVPRYTADYGGEYPLRLISVPDSHTLNSIFLEREDLTEKRGLACLMLHPLDAEARGIKDGQSVVAYNDLAQVEFAARVTDRVLSLIHIFLVQNNGNRADHRPCAAV